MIFVVIEHWIWCEIRTEISPIVLWICSQYPNRLAPNYTTTHVNIMSTTERKNEATQTEQKWKSLKSVQKLMWHDRYSYSKLIILHINSIFQFPSCNGRILRSDCNPPILHHSNSSIRCHILWLLSQTNELYHHSAEFIGNWVENDICNDE